MLQLLEQVDTVRKQVGQQISPKRKSELGQFMTPLAVARFMASLFQPSTLQPIRLLDAGAGIGSLTGAFLDNFATRWGTFQHIEAVAYEIDAKLRNHLSRTLAEYQGKFDLGVNVLSEDFISGAVNLALAGERPFTHAILNPPYKKISSDSRNRFLLREVGIETVNLYSAFVALAVNLMRDGGQIVAIIPRSFCNGPYYRPFREILFEKTAIRHMHLFDSRTHAFKDDDVLQENIIILLERDAKQGPITISTSTDDSFSDVEINLHPFDRIVFPDDPERFIHIPTAPDHDLSEVSTSINQTLAGIGLAVSTGPVVDFRMKPHLRQMPESGTVPLLYPLHFSGKSLSWPKADAKKPNAIIRNSETEKWLFPAGNYVVVRRFSSKEEKRRVVANFIAADDFDSSALGLENHLNVFHFGKKGIPENLARGLAVYLNSMAVDEQFRRFSGHTQVNATDLKSLKYPPRDVLTDLGIWAKSQREITQTKIDEKIESLTWKNTKI